MSSMPALLTPAGVKSNGAAAQPSRAASAVVAKPARGFQVFRIDGYSWTTTLPAGECITSDTFIVGGRTWQIDYYPNGTDPSSTDDSAIAVYLRYVSSTYQGGYHLHKLNERVRAQFKFSLLDLSGTPAYELPAETAVFRQQVQAADPANLGCGNAEFIAREELERRGQSLLAEDCLAIRCDVGVVELEVMAVGPKQKGHGATRHGYGDAGDDSDEEDGGRRKKTQDEREFIRRCLTQRRRT